MGMIELSKKATIDVVNSLKLVEVHFGTVLSDDLDIRIEQKLTLSEAFFIIPKRLKVDDPIVVGDKVILLRVQGGQHYLILDKVV